jgi:hypothetical protein
LLWLGATSNCSKYSAKTYWTTSASCKHHGRRALDRPGTPAPAPHWKPFTGPLQPSSIRQALTILSALFSYLSEAGYRRGNPFKLVRQRQTGHTLPERFLDQQSLASHPRTLENCPCKPAANNNKPPAPAG